MEGLLLILTLNHCVVMLRELIESIQKERKQDSKVISNKRENPLIYLAKVSSMNSIKS